MQNLKTDFRSKDIKQLIHKTDIAVKSVGSIISNTIAPSQECYPNQDTSTISISNPSSQIKLREQYQRSIARGAFFIMPKPKTPQKYKNQSSNGPTRKLSKMTRSMSTSSLRQAATGATGGMTAPFNGLAFNQASMDGMMDADNIRKGMIENVKENRLRRLSETIHDRGSIKPFDQDDFPPHIHTAAAGRFSQSQDTASSFNKPLGDNRMTYGSSTNRTTPDPRAQTLDTNCDSQTPRYSMRSLTGQLASPNFPPASSGRPWKQFPHVSLSLDSTLPRRVPTFSSGSQMDTEAKIKANVDLAGGKMVLKSTPYSLTCFGFRHGDIRLNERLRLATDSKRNRIAKSNFTVAQVSSDQVEGSDSQSGDEEGKGDRGLDWTAFQMAISGVASDHWMDGSEDMSSIDGPGSSIEDLEAELDEILKWWSETGLEAGSLVRSDLTVRKMRPKVGFRRQTSLEARAEHFPIELETPEKTHYLKTNLDETHEHAGSCPPNWNTWIEKGWGAERRNDGKGEEFNENENSLPPSPMEIISPAALASFENFVPMGPTIGHDLRDFLRWNSECVDRSVEGEMLPLS